MLLPIASSLRPVRWRWSRSTGEEGCRGYCRRPTSSRWYGLVRGYLGDEMTTPEDFIAVQRAHAECGCEAAVADDRIGGKRLSGYEFG